MPSLVLPDGSAVPPPPEPNPPAAPPHVPRWILYGLVGASVLILWPYWIWIVLSVWVGQGGRKLMRPLGRVTGGRQRAAAILTALLLAIIVVPIVAVIATLLFDAIDLVKRLMASPQINSFFEQLVTPSSTSEATKQQQPLDLLMQHGGRAWEIVGAVFAVAAEMVLGLFIFLSGVFTVLAEGPAAYRWLEQYLPIEGRLTRRFAAAFSETGHGLFVGVGGAGLAQAIVATIAYVVIDVPEPYVLGLVTLMASVLPSVGTALVWVPVAIGLALTGRTEAAIGLSVVGVLVIGSIDNLVRPILARWGQLELPSFLIMVSMFGGITLVGASGVVLGPLVLRMAKEALVMTREERVAGAQAG